MVSRKSEHAIAFLSSKNCSQSTPIKKRRLEENTKNNDEDDDYEETERNDGKEDGKRYRSSMRYFKYEHCTRIQTIKIKQHFQSFGQLDSLKCKFNKTSCNTHVLARWKNPITTTNMMVWNIDGIRPTEIRNVPGKSAGSWYTAQSSGFRPSHSVLL